MAQLNLDEGTMSVLVQKSILDAMTPELKEKIIAEAVQSLLTRRSGVSMMTPLERLFRDAVKDAAYDLVRKQLDDSDAMATVVEAVTPMVTELAAKTVSDLSEQINEAVEAAVGSWLRSGSGV